MTILKEISIIIVKYNAGVNKIYNAYCTRFENIIQKFREGANAIRATQKLILNKFRLDILYNLMYQSKVAPINKTTYIGFDFDVISECITDRGFPVPSYKAKFYDFRQICMYGMIYMRTMIAMEDLQTANELINRTLTVCEEFPYIEDIPLRAIDNEIKFVSRSSIAILKQVRLSPYTLNGKLTTYDRAQYSIAHNLEKFNTYIAELVLKTEERMS